MHRRDSAKPCWSGLGGILDTVIAGSGEPLAEIKYLLEFAEQLLDIKFEDDPVSHDDIQSRTSKTVARGSLPHADIRVQSMQR